MDKNLDTLLARVKKMMHYADSAHDFEHVMRVFKLSKEIGKKENADLDILLPASLLHDICNFPKDHPSASLSADKSAETASFILKDENYSPEQIKQIMYAISSHSYSKGILPETKEAKILQDADRLDALGAIGIGRVFAVSAELKRQFYDWKDPFCQQRDLDDKKYGIDHFYTKILKLKDTLHTNTAKEIAEERTAFVKSFLEQLKKEIS